jgi:O-antigen ligase
MTENYSKNRWWLVILLASFLIIAIFLSNYNYLISLAIIAFVFFIILFFLKPLFGLYLMALFLPITGLAVQYKSLELPFIDLLSVVVLTSFVVSHIYLTFFDKNKTKLKWPAGGAFLAFFIIVLISAILSDGVLSHLWYSFRWILFFYLAFVIMPVNLVKSTKILHKLLVLISIGGLAVALMGFVSLFLQDWSDSFFRVSPVAIGGEWIFGQNYNLLSEFLSISAFIVLSLKYFYNDLRINRLLNVLAGFLILINFLTFGRTAWITIVLQLLIYFVIYYFIIQKKKISWRQALVALFLLVIILSPFFVKMITLQEANVSSTQNRVLLTKISWEAFLDKPLFGYGSGSFVSLVENNVRFVAKYGDPLDSHGFGQKILAENGILGLLSFIIFLFFMFRKIYLGVIINKKDYRLLLPLFIASAGGFFYQLFNTSYYKGRIWLPIALAWIAVELISSKNKVKKYER